VKTVALRLQYEGEKKEKRKHKNGKDLQTGINHHEASFKSRFAFA